jgi:WD40 repeat protein
MLADLQEVASGVMDVTAGVVMLEASALEAAEIENPYKGLRAFSEVDAADFFGRETLIQELLGRLGQEKDDLSRFLAVVGPSGSGKSSVVKAGLIPALRRGGLPGSEDWFVVDFIPGAHPLEELEAALLRVAVNPPESLLGQLQESERGLLRAVRRILPPDNSVELVLVIDQFEEVFTLVNDESVRTHFLESLLTAVLDPRSRLRVILTLRADFTDRPLQYVDFGELVRQRTEFVLPLTPDELELAITGPARRVGLVLEPGLVNRIMRNVGDQPGELPLLQYALTELFEHRSGRRLTLAAYEESGGVLGALGRRAEEIFNGLDQQAQVAARQIFLRLVTLGEGTEDTRRRVLRTEFEGLISDQGIGDRGEGEVIVDQDSLISNQQSTISNVLDSFGNARLLTFDRDPLTRAPTVEVAHEALLNVWRRLREWLDESRVDIRMQRVLGNAAVEWLEAERDPGFLLRGSRLDQYEAWAATSDMVLTLGEQEYLDASLEERRARRVAEAERRGREATLERRSRNFLRGLVVVLALAAIVAGVLSAVAFQQRQAARNQAGILLASQAETEIENGFTDRAILLALEALENYPYTSQAEHALGQAVTNNKALQLYAGHTACITGAAWSSDGKRVATSSMDNSVHIWDPITGENIRVIQLPEGITGNIRDWALTVQWSPDDRYLLSVAGDRFTLGSQDFDLILWDATSGEQVASVEVQNATPPAAGEGIAASLERYVTGAGAAFASDGRLATLGGDNTALVWGPMLEDQLLVLRGHTDGVNGIDWSSDFKRLVTASEDGTARIWDAGSGEELLQLVGHEGGVNRAAWSPDGNLVATAGDDGSLRIWEAASGETLTSIQVAPSTESTTPVDLIVWALAWSPDGRYLATGTGDGYIRVWEVESEEKLLEVKGHDESITYLAWSPEDDRLVSTGGEGRARIWKVTPDNLMLSLPYDYVNIGSWSPDGRYFTVGTNPGPDFSNVGTVAVWDVNAPSPLLETSLDKDKSWDFLSFYSPKGTYILARTMKVWPDTTDANKYYLLDSQTGEIVRILETNQDTLLTIPGWSPDEQQVVAGDIHGTIYFWEVSTGALTRTMNCLSWGHIVEWSPDGDRIAMLCFDFEADRQQIQVLDAQTYELLQTISGENFFWFSWSPDSTRIAAASGSVETGAHPVDIFDAKNGEKLLTIIGHTRDVTGIGWSPDGQRLVSGSNDGTTRIWDAETGGELLTLSTPANYNNMPFWSPDGNKLLVAIFNTVGVSRSGVWRVWQSTQELIDYAYECCVFRELTPEERQLFGLPER